MKVPKVYIDTNVIKFSATELPRLRPRKESVDWGGKQIEITLHDFVEVNPNENITNPELRVEADLLITLAEMCKAGKINCVMQHETLWESWGLGNTDSKRGRFYGAPIKFIRAPIEYNRIMAGGLTKSKELQYQFLAGVSDRRFHELQKITGAYQGQNKLNHNQLLDAFHLWCAEHNRCDFFLTLDFKLIRMLERSSAQLAVRAVRPSELLQMF